MDYTFLTYCPKCGEEFSVFWVMDLSRVGLECVAQISCAACGQTFWQRKGDLLYDCPCCGKHGIFVSLIQTDLPWEGLSKERENVRPD